MIEFFLDHVLYDGKVYYHSVSVQIFCPTIYGNDPVVAVQIFALQVQLVGSTYFKAFFDVVHIIDFIGKDRETLISYSRICMRFLFL